MQARRPRSGGEYDPLAPAFIFFAGVSPAILIRQPFRLRFFGETIPYSLLPTSYYLLPISYFLIFSILL
ncbi:MAG: hypothetical protein LBP59_03595 [Planctomycetaceae bacterium]|nr:hypothetical protein [Planctomycetaceae bacterium]